MFLLVFSREIKINIQKAASIQNIWNAIKKSKKEHKKSHSHSFVHKLMRLLLHFHAIVNKLKWKHMQKNGSHSEETFCYTSTLAEKGGKNQQFVCKKTSSFKKQTIEQKYKSTKLVFLWHNCNQKCLLYFLFMGMSSWGFLKLFSLASIGVLGHLFSFI